MIEYFYPTEDIVYTWSLGVDSTYFFKNTLYSMKDRLEYSPHRGAIYEFKDGDWNYYMGLSNADTESADKFLSYMVSPEEVKNYIMLSELVK